jgi:hypothetical protein
MKKTIIAIVSFLMISSSVLFADTTLGLKVGNGTLNAKDVGTVNNVKGDKSADATFASVFLEKSLDLNVPATISLGVEYIPFTATIDIDTTNGGDYSGQVKNHTTLYVQAAKEVRDGFKVMANAGYVMAKISGVKSNTLTLTSNDTSLNGFAYGVAIQKDLNTRFTDFVRIGADWIDYDTVEAKTSSDTYKADADANTYYIAIGKKF